MADRQNESTPFAAFVGIDWASETHAVCVLDPQDDKPRSHVLEHTPEAIHAWALKIKQRYQDAPVAVAVEQAHGGLVHALREHSHLVLFSINPKQACAYREALSAAGRKSDPEDAWLLARMLGDLHHQLRPWQPNSQATRRLQRLCELRRKTVDARASGFDHSGTLRFPRLSTSSASPYCSQESTLFLF